MITQAHIERYDVSGPRYTSYPTADRFVEAFDAAVRDRVLDGSSSAEAVSLGLRELRELVVEDGAAGEATSTKHRLEALPHSGPRSRISFRDRNYSFCKIY